MGLGMGLGLALGLSLAGDAMETRVWVLGIPGLVGGCWGVVKRYGAVAGALLGRCWDADAAGV